MAGIVQTLLTSRDLTGPAFASARAGLQGIAISGNQTSGSLAGVSGASETTAVRMGVLTDRIRLQEQQLEILHAKLQLAASAETADALAIMRAQHAYDVQTTSIRQNNAALDRLHLEQRETPIALNRTTGAVGSLAGAMGGLTSTLGTLGIAFSAQQVVGWTVEAGKAANTLERTEETLHQLLPVAADYNNLVAIAGVNQRLFGGSVDANLQGLQGLALLAKNANTEISTLNASAQKLTIKSPEQGSMGAMVALTELLTGKGAESTRSLRMRYELTAAGLNKIEQATTVTEKLALLDEELATFGVTNATVTARLKTTSQTYVDLGIDAERLKLKIGGLVTEGLQPAAKVLDDMLIAAKDSGALTALGEFFKATGTEIKTTADILDKAKTSFQDMIPEQTKSELKWLDEMEDKASAKLQWWVRTATNQAMENIGLAQKWRLEASEAKTAREDAYKAPTTADASAPVAATGPWKYEPGTYTPDPSRRVAGADGGSSAIGPSPATAAGAQNWAAAPIIIQIQSTVMEPQKITSLVQEGIREYERANGRPH